MKLIFAGLFVMFVFSFSAFSQTNSSKLKTFELFGSIRTEDKSKIIAAGSSCFSFITESPWCGSNSDINYGGLRKGDDWDWFRVMGVGSRNKIKSLGAKNWNDKLEIPVVEPYKKLEKGEQRRVVVDASGKKGKDGEDGKGGKPGMNADGAFNKDSIVEKNKQPQANLKTDEKTESSYQPFEKAVLGNMYVMRVVDDENDFYVLFRVDELERGTKCKISWKIIDAPKAS